MILIQPDEPLISPVPDGLFSQAIKVFGNVFRIIRAAWLPSVRYSPGEPAVLLTLIDAGPSAGPGQAVVNGRFPLTGATDKLSAAVRTLLDIAVINVILARC